MGLKEQEFAQFGGVDSRSSPINMPPNRAILARNVMLNRDGHLRLRDGYTQVPLQQGIQASGPIHSMISYKTLGGERAIIYAQDLNLFVFLPRTGIVVSYPVLGKPLAGNGRWSWALAGRWLYGTNGIDRKFFDGDKWRDPGLRGLTKEEVANVVLSPGVPELTTQQASAVAVTQSPGGSFLADTLTGRLIYVALFDTSANELGPSSVPVGPARIKVAFENQINLSGLPDLATTNAAWVKLVGGTLDGGDLAYFFTSAGPSTIETCARTGPSPSTTLHVTLLASEPYLPVTGDIVVLKSGDFSGFYLVTSYWDALRQFTQTMERHFLVTLSKPVGADSIGGTVSKLVSADNAATTASILRPDQYVGLEISTERGIPPSTVGTADAGYQFYASLYNPFTTHVGNRIAIGGRIVPTVRSNWRITGLPDLSAEDSEWAILLGRTNDGAQVPYVSTDIAENWVYIPNGETSAIIDAGNIDGASELPTRNGLPPANLSALARVGDYLYGIVSDGPWIYRSEQGIDDTDGHVGRPEQSWPGQCETFPTGDNPIGIHGFNGDAWIQTLEDLAILVDQEGIPAWQGPWQGAGIASQEAFTVGWKGLPYWISGHKQLQTMTAEGPIPISDEYEAALLSQIKDEYLSEVQLVSYREIESQLEFLAIKARR